MVMSRKRVLLDGVPYHVTARANRKEALLETDLAKCLFVEILARTKEKYDFRLDNFVVMENHIHLLIWPSKGQELSAIMRRVLGSFSLSYNHVFSTCGHFWGDRYYSRPITSFEEYLAVSDYIDVNPEKAELIDNARDWEWSGLHHHRSGRCDITEAPDWLIFLRPAHAVTVTIRPSTAVTVTQ